MRACISMMVAFTLVAGAARGEGHHKKKVEEAPPPAAPAATAPEPAKGELVPFTVVCATPGAAIFVDGDEIGATPMDLPVPVTPGDHSIKVTRLGYAPFIDVFSTKGKKEVKVELELVPVSGVIHVKSNVPGARVMIDGRYVGDAPIDLEADVGPRAVQVSKVCYQDFFQNVMAVAGQELPVDANLAELPPDKNPCRPPPPEPPKWYKKKWVWGVVAGGAVVVAGAVATGVYFGTQDFMGPADVMVAWHP